LGRDQFAQDFMVQSRLGGTEEFVLEYWRIYLWANFNSIDETSVRF
jgi:hypothetical protein